MQPTLDFRIFFFCNQFAIKIQYENISLFCGENAYLLWELLSKKGKSHNNYLSLDLTYLPQIKLGHGNVTKSIFICRSL